MTAASREGIPLEPTEIATGDLQLRIWDSSHRPAVLAALNDPQISAWNPLRREEEPGNESDDALADRWIAERSTWDNHATWAVCDAVTGDALGYVSLHQLDLVHQRGGEVGYWVLPAARSRGIATRAVAAAARYGFGALGLHRIELFHAVDNPASCRVAIGAGFLVEGTARQAYRYGDGLFHDDHMHARLASDPAPLTMG